MLLKTLAVACCAALFATGAIAQAPAPATSPATTAAPASPDAAPARTPRVRRPRATAPAATDAAPAAAAPAATTPAAPAPTAAAVPAGTKVNLNTATAAQLDALPSVGKARLKVIMDERAKAPFRDWDDFDKRTAHTSVNAGVKRKIKDSVTF